MALKALVNCFGWQIEERKEILVNCIDAKGAAKAKGTAEMEGFWVTWVGKLEPVREALGHLRSRVEM